MPAKSKKQFRFMQMMAHNKNKARDKSDISPSQAKEFLEKNTGEKSYSKLPESKEKYKKVRKMLKK